MKKCLLILLFGCALSALSMASPVRPWTGTVVGPDGREYQVSRRGDEFLSWLETADGQRLRRQADGSLEFLSADDYQQAMEGAQKMRALRYSSSRQQKAATPVKGVFRQLLLLVEFDDVSFQTQHNGKPLKDAVDSLLNGSNYRANGAIGSVRQYYSDNSMGELDFQTVVAGPIKLNNRREYYGANNAKGDDVKPREMVVEALNMLEAMDVGFDFTPFGINGVSPGIFILYAGHGAEQAEDLPNAIWAHKWELGTQALTLDGVKFNDYACSPELAGESSSMAFTNIGVICHELGHSLGLPDLYDTDYAKNGSAKGLGEWSLMANGNWNGDGLYPPYLNAFERNLLGWHEPSVLTNISGCLLNPISNRASSYRMNTPVSGEFYILEVRQKKGWDLGLPGEGLMIYHIDRSATYLPRWTAGTKPGINADSLHECFRIKSAVNNTTAAVSGDAWPQSSATEFSDASVPSTRSWNGSKTEGFIKNITREPEGGISFSYSKPVAETAYNITLTAGEGGSIRPSGTVRVDAGDRLEFSVIPATGYAVDGIKYSGRRKVSFRMGGAPALEKVSSDGSVHVSFKRP